MELTLFSLKSVAVTTQLRVQKLLQVCVLGMFQDAFNLAKKNWGIILTVVWCQPEALAGINVPLCEVL